jgi:hypothetical protein
MFFGSAYVNKCAFSSFRVHISIALRFSSLSSVAVNSILCAGLPCNCCCGKFFKIEMRVVLSQVLNLHLVISSGDILLDKSSTLNPIQQRIYVVESISLDAINVIKPSKLTILPSRRICMNAKNGSSS